MNDAAELIRLRYKYRRLLMEGSIKLPLEGAVKLMGPDCAYHLYFMADRRDAVPEELKRSSGTSQDPT